MGVGGIRFSDMRVGGVQSSAVHMPLAAASGTVSMAASASMEASPEAFTKASPEAVNPYIEKDGAESIILDISAEAEEAAKRAAKRKEEKLMRERQAKENYFASVLEEMRKTREQTESLGEVYEDRYRCLEIAMRIMAGDNVPVSDQRYLAEKDMEMYARAVSFRRTKEDPKDYDSLLDDEDARGGNANGFGGENGTVTVAVTGSVGASSGAAASSSVGASSSADNGVGSNA